MVPNLIRFTCLFLLLTAAAAEAGDQKRPTPDDYWLQILKIASDEFRGIDLNPTLQTGYQFSGENRGVNVGMAIELPLWNKAKQFKRREEAVRFLQSGADLVQKLETTINTLELLKTKSRFLKAIMQDNGVESVEAFFRAEQEIIQFESLVTQHHRELQGLIKPVGTGARVLTGKTDRRDR